MQHELRAALWRNARLAALGTVVAKVSHDLRGILTPALLTAERLQLNADPQVQRAGEILAAGRRSGDRPGAADARLCARGAAAAGTRPGRAGAAGRRGGGDGAAGWQHLRLENAIDPAILVHGRPHPVVPRPGQPAAQCRRGRRARASVFAAQHDSPTLVIEIADDGPGLPEAVRADLFRPFAGSMRRGGTGLGLAIARDLMVAHGGDIELVDTGPAGTTFRLHACGSPIWRRPPEPEANGARRRQQAQH